MIKVLQIGCGKMSKYTMQYVYDKGDFIVGAIDNNPNIIGKDIGSIIGSDNKGVLVESLDNLETVIKETNPNIAIVTTMSLLNDIKDVLVTLASNGINTITTCEEAFYGANSNPIVFDLVDKLAKENNCTITGSGYQDVFWGNLITTILGSTASVKEIKGSSSYNVEDYGIALAKAHGAGLSLDEFDKQIASVDRISDEERNDIINKGEYMPSYMWNTVGWLADKLNLTITSMKQKCVPKEALEDMHSETLNMDIKKGDATGMSAIVTATTKENITITCECIGKVYTNEEFDKNEWSIIGEPDTTVIVNKPDTVKLTCADIVNRIPDVIASPNGFIPTSKMPTPKYRENKTA